MVDKPLFLEMLSFVYFYPTCIIGPSFDFKDYIDFIHLRNCYSRIPFVLTMQFGLGYLLLTIMCMGVYTAFNKRFGLEYIGTVEYGEHPLWYRLLYVNISIIAHRCKFYSGFLLSFTSLIFSGLSYGELLRKKNDPPVLRAINGDYQITFDKGSYGSIYDCELGLNPKTKITNWNHSIHLWLKYNCFLRLINVNKKFLLGNFGFAGIMTYLLSAFWHGFYITYYIFFFGLYLYQTGNEVFDKLGLFEYIERSNVFIFKFLIWFQAQFIINGLGAIFFLLKYDLFIQYMKNVYGIPMILAIGAFLLSKFFVLKKKKQETTDKGKGKEANKKTQ